MIKTRRIEIAGTVFDVTHISHLNRPMWEAQKRCMDALKDCIGDKRIYLVEPATFRKLNETAVELVLPAEIATVETMHMLSNSGPMQELQRRGVEIYVRTTDEKDWQ